MDGFQISITTVAGLRVELDQKNIVPKKLNFFLMVCSEWRALLWV